LPKKVAQLISFLALGKINFMSFKIILTALLLSSGFCGIAQEESLKLASDIWPPFTNVEGEKRIANDIVSKALANIDITNSLEIVDFSSVMTGIYDGTYAGSGALWYSDERAKELLFSKPYLYNQLILVGRKGSDVSATNFKELGSAKIAVVENYAYGDLLLENTQITFFQGKSDQKNLEQLLSKKVDYILVDALLIQYLLKYQTNDVSHFLEIGSTPLSTKALHFALHKKVANAAEIIQQFNAEIDTMMADGTYHQILELNWMKIDMDGDGSLELVLIGDAAGLDAPGTAYSIDPNAADLQ
jgi:ABC-type amino acid transport substrate-binding protein